MSGDVRLQLAELVRIQPANVRHAVRLRAPLELAQPLELALVEGDDDLPALDVADVALLAVRAQEPDPASAELRLERSRRVVDAGVRDPAVPTRLVSRDRGLLLQDRDDRVRPELRQAARDGEADDPGAHHADLLARTAHPKPGEVAEPPARDRYDPKYSFEERGPYSSQRTSASNTAVTSDGRIALVGPTKT